MSAIINVSPSMSDTISNYLCLHMLARTGYQILAKLPSLFELLIVWKQVQHDAHGDLWVSCHRRLLHAPTISNSCEARYRETASQLWMTKCSAILA